MLIQKAKTEDCKDIYDLVLILKNNLDFKKFENAFNYNLNKENVYYYLLKENDQTIGFISIIINYQLHHADKVATVEELVINPKFQGKKYGTSLLNYAIELAKNEKCNVIELTSNFSREEAHKFYEKNGFIKSSYKFKYEF